MHGTREKLIEVLTDDNCPLLLTQGEVGNLADYLIANGVTVGKPLTEFLHPEDAYPGLKEKYLVFKADTGEEVAGCFILRPAKDPAAVEALRAYAGATDNETLAEDIYNWVGKGVTFAADISVGDKAASVADKLSPTDGQKWIPLTELPKEV